MTVHYYSRDLNNVRSAAGVCAPERSRRIVCVCVCAMCELKCDAVRGVLAVNGNR